MKLVRTAAALALASAATVAVTLFPAGPAQADISWGFGDRPADTAQASQSVQSRDISWG